MEQCLPLTRHFSTDVSANKSSDIDKSTATKQCKRVPDLWRPGSKDTMQKKAEERNCYFFSMSQKRSSLSYSIYGEFKKTTTATVYIYFKKGCSCDP